jgi:hypothetical protein
MASTTAELPETQHTGLINEAKRWLWFSLLYNLAEAIVSTMGVWPGQRYRNGGQCGGALATG